MKTTLNAIRAHSPCECGCGMAAPLAQRNNARLKHFKGEPLRFVPGHNRRVAPDFSRINVAANGCWIWTGPIGRKGYARIQVAGVHRHAHRALWEALNGPIDARLHLDHLCRNRACVNPSHMEPVTPAENNRRKTSPQAAELRRICARVDAMGAA